MEDIQGQGDTREVAIARAGIRDLRAAASLRLRDGAAQATIATWNLAANVDHQARGVHMSRFVELVTALDEPLDAAVMSRLSADVRERLEARSAFVEVEATLFLERRAPATGASAAMDYTVRYRAEGQEGRARITMSADVAVTNLCPCSKAISDYGAHNQRGLVTVSVRAVEGAEIWFEDLVTWVESSASSPLYPILKRPDERVVTMGAFDKPRFVEDIVREVAVVARRDERIADYHIVAINDESIHHHNAYAEVLSRGWSC